MSGDPWHDYLAFPIAPFVLFAQIGFLFIEKRAMRWTLVSACFLWIVAMYLYVASIDVAPGEGANIGLGLMTFSLGGAILVLVAGIVREVAHVVYDHYSARQAAGKN